MSAERNSGRRGRRSGIGVLLRLFMLGAVVTLVAAMAPAPARAARPSDPPGRPPEHFFPYGGVQGPFRAPRPALEGGRRPFAFIGVSMGNVTPALVARYQLPDDKSYGVLVNRVIPGSPADKAQLKTGDVIHDVDGEPVRSPAELLQAVAYKAVGSEVSLDVSRPGPGYRGSSEMQFQLKVVARTDGIDVREALRQMRELRDRVGRRVERIGADPLAIGGLSIGEASTDGSVPGLRVFAVVPNSDAAMAGFFQGDLVRKVNGQEVNTRQELLKVLDEADPKKNVDVDFERDGKMRTIHWALPLPLPTPTPELILPPNLLLPRPHLVPPAAVTPAPATTPATK